MKARPSGTTMESVPRRILRRDLGAREARSQIWPRPQVRRGRRRHQVFKHHGMLVGLGDQGPLRPLPDEHQRARRSHPDLAKYDLGKGTVRFPIGRSSPMP
jgi:hypothetical protein